MEKNGSFGTAPSDPASDLLLLLAEEFGASTVLTGAEVAGSYLEDWSRERTGRCIAVLRPDSVQAVSRICQLCASAKVGIVPQGGHTGLVGGAQRDVADCVVLSTSRLNSIRGIDPDNLTAIVDAGVVLQSLQDALSVNGLEFPVSIGSQGSAQIGGLISTNAGGLQVVRHGMTGAHVQGLEMVLQDGRIVSTITGLHKDNRGPDPLRIAIGGEGVFGIVTAACLRLTPIHRDSASAYVGCESFDTALALLRHVRDAAYEFLTAFEVMSSDCLPLALLVDPSLLPPLEAPVQVLIRLKAVARLPITEILETALSEALKQGLVLDAVIAQSERQADRFWKLREAIVEGHSKRGYHVRSDVSVRLGYVPKLVAALEAMLETAFPGWTPQAYGHMGDGNIHFNALPPEGMDPLLACDAGARIEAQIFNIALSFGGSFSAEHGIGRTKAEWFSRTAAPQKLDLLRQIKSSFDPDWRMNPGCLLTKPTHLL